MVNPVSDVQPSERPRPPRLALFRGLSGKVLTLIMLFIMLGEVLIYVPSIANFRVGWLRQRIEAAQIATLVLEATPDQMVSEKLKTELLKNANAKAVALKRADSRHLMLGATENMTIDKHFDLRTRSLMMTLYDAFDYGR